MKLPCWFLILQIIADSDEFYYSVLPLAYHIDIPLSLPQKHPKPSVDVQLASIFQPVKQLYSR
jgi:hypothetical protein